MTTDIFWFIQFTHRDYCIRPHWRQHLNGDVHGLTVTFHTIDDALHRDDL